MKPLPKVKPLEIFPEQMDTGVDFKVMEQMDQTMGETEAQPICSNCSEPAAERDDDDDATPQPLLLLRNSFRQQPLGIVFDIDGTLIAEGEDVLGAIIRPDAVAFLRWCLQSGHRLAIWTAASESWADFVIKKLCPQVHSNSNNNLSEGEPHQCTGSLCRKTFDFVWVGDDMKRMNRSAIPVASKQGHCVWCDFYSHTCQECSCHYGAAECDCRWTKDLRKIWDHPAEETARFTQERTLLIENTPQRCRLNYGNAIYVPTYQGGPTDERGNIFQALQSFVQEELDDDSIDVRKVAKCHHRGGPHACFEQSWWPKQEEDSDDENDSDDEQDNLEFEFQMFESFLTRPTITLSCWENHD